MSFDWGDFFQILAGALAVIGQWRMGNKLVSGPAFGLVGQAAWALMSITNETYYLLIFTALMAGTHVRNLRKWLREEKD